MKLKEYIKAVKTLCVELHAEDMDSYETSALDNKIIMAANMGARDLASNTYPLIKSAKMDGPAEWVPPEDFLSLQNYEGGRAGRFYNAEGKECLSLKEAGPYRITYRHLPKAVRGPEDTFEFPEHVMNALIYYGAYHVLSSDNDKRGFVYFKNLYDQACVNILANRPSKLTVVRAKRGGMHVL
jgi:hypothetical protein